MADKRLGQFYVPALFNRWLMSRQDSNLLAGTRAGHVKDIEIPAQPPFELLNGTACLR